MNLLIMGAPGTGKGTMSKLIVDEFGVKHVSTGDMLRSAVSEGTEVGLKAQEYMSKGALVPDEIIHDIIVEYLGKADLGEGFLFDGYPRTYAQAVDLDNILKELDLKIDLVINLNVDEDVLAERITTRRICKKCGEIYNIRNKNPKVEGVCDVCGGQVYQRKDDTLESLQTRLSEYHKNTEPVIEYYENAGLVRQINGEQGSADKVFEEVKAVIEACK